jgi:hypothetical protein
VVLNSLRLRRYDARPGADGQGHHPITTAEAPAAS